MGKSKNVMNYKNCFNQALCKVASITLTGLKNKMSQGKSKMSQKAI